MTAANLKLAADTLGVLALAVVSLPQPVAYAVLVVIMGLNGAINRSMQLGYFSYAQDSALEIDRPMYIGAVSSTAGTASLMPLIGGLLIDGLQRAGANTIAYPAVFALAALSALAGAVISLKLPTPRRAV